MTSVSELFGGAIDSDEEMQPREVQGSAKWLESVRIEHEIVKGLYLFPRAIPYDMQADLIAFAWREMSESEEPRWDTQSRNSAKQLQNVIKNNQLMYFGTLPAKLHETIRLLATLLPTTLSLDPFNQLIINYYPPGKGIKPHVDLMRFQDGIVGVSLVSSVVMQFRPRVRHSETQYGERDPNECCCGGATCPIVSASEQIEQIEQSASAQALLLNPGDVYVMTGDSRWHWTHEIAETSQDTLPTNPQSLNGKLVENQVLDRRDRISYTFRRLTTQ